MMYHCTNCGAEVEELYRRYCPRVLKLLKCDKCGLLADKYIEYDPAIILVDLILIQKCAYRHLLYNCNHKFYWKLVVVLWLVESFRNFYLCDPDLRNSHKSLDTTCNLYLVLIKTSFSLAAFVLTVVFFTEIKWFFGRRRPNGYNVKTLTRALVIGGSGKLLGLLEIVWRHVLSGPHYVLIQGYTILCLLTAYSVVCNTGKLGSFIVLAMGLISYNCAANLLSISPVLLEILDPI